MELIEPELFLELAEDGGEAFAVMVFDWLRRMEGR